MFTKSAFAVLVAVYVVMLMPQVSMNYAYAATPDSLTFDNIDYSVYSNRQQLAFEAREQAAALTEKKEYEEMRAKLDAEARKQEELAKKQAAFLAARKASVSLTEQSDGSVSGGFIGQFTGYSSTPDQTMGDPFITASGAHVRVGTLACPRNFAFGTKIKVEGVPYVLTCEDRGGAIVALGGGVYRFDIWFESRGAALQWGRKTRGYEIVK